MPLFRFFFAAWELPRLHKRSRVRSSRLAAVWKLSVFLQLYSLMPDDPQKKRKGSSKNRNAMWKLLTQNFTSLQNVKRKTSFRAIANAVRESAVCLHRSFATYKWVDGFHDGTDLQIDRGVTRLDGARGKMQVRRPHFRARGLPEANVLYWRMYVWHCWDFLAPPQHFSAPRVIWYPGNCSTLPLRYAPADWTLMQRVKSYRHLR